MSVVSRSCVGTLNLSKMTTAEKAIFWVTKAIFYFYHFAIPLMYSPRSIVELIFLYIIGFAFEGWLLAFLFQVSLVPTFWRYVIICPPKFAVR